jgi:hypothetical protein
MLKLVSVMIGASDRPPENHFDYPYEPRNADLLTVLLVLIPH